MLKIDLDKFPSEKLIEFLSNAENLKILSDKIFFINDFVFTQDFSGLINKEEGINWLAKNRVFRLQGIFDTATYTILDNDYKISRNCLTFIKYNYIDDIKYKFSKILLKF